jgi:hypothetical protein
MCVAVQMAQTCGCIDTVMTQPFHFQGESFLNRFPYCAKKGEVSHAQENFLEAHSQSTRIWAKLR